MPDISFYAKEARLISHVYQRMPGCTAAAGSLLVFTLLLHGSGCDRTAEVAATRQTTTDQGSHFTSVSLSPRAIIDEVVSTYQKLDAYQDAGSVVLRYRLDGEPLEDRAPLAVAWTRGGSLGLEVYSLKAGPHESRWRLRIDRPDMRIEDQVLSRALPDKADFAWLLSDPFVGQALSAGLAGFPPQLDLLMSPEPLSGLVNESAAVTFDPQESVDGRSCHVLAVTQANGKYRLFVDQASLLLRRLELPQANLPREMLGDRRITDIQLSIELEDIRTQQPMDWERFRVTVDQDDTLVHHFVPAPPAIETRGLGTKVPSFRLADPTGQVVFQALATAPDSRQAPERVKVLMWLADHPACKLAAAQFSRVAERIQQDQELADRIEFIPVWAEPEPADGETFESLPVSWRLPGKLTIDREAMGRDLFAIEEAPSLVVLDGRNRVQLIERTANPILDQVLPDILARIARGDDLAEELLDKARDIRGRHVAQLRAALAIDGQGKELPDPLPYQPELCELKRIQSLPHSVAPPAVSSVADAQGHVWTLHEDGALVRVSVLTKQTPLALESRGLATQSARLAIDPSGRFAAIGGYLTNQLQLVDADQNEIHTMQLAPEAKLIDFQWLRLHGGSKARLAALTTDQELLLLDPTNHEQLSGRCPAKPLALIANTNQQLPVEGLVVLSNRNVEPIALSEDSAHHQAPLLGRPAAYRGKSHAAKSSLPFQPQAGPWLSWQDSEGQRTLAGGWLAQDEPVFYMLNEQLAPLWHYRASLQPHGTPPPQLSVAEDPATGLTCWLVLDAAQTIHILRADGLTDQFRPDQPVVGATLLTAGDQLILATTHSDSVNLHALRWLQ